MSGESLPSFDSVADLIAAIDEGKCEFVSNHVHARLGSDFCRNVISRQLEKKRITPTTELIDEAVNEAFAFYRGNPNNRAGKALNSLRSRLGNNETENLKESDVVFARKAADLIFQQERKPTAANRFHNRVGKILGRAANNESKPIIRHTEGSLKRVYYGLENWTERRIAEQSPWDADKNIHEAIEDMPDFDSSKSSEIEFAASRLLAICLQYLQSKQVAEGLTIRSAPSDPDGERSIEDIPDTGFEESWDPDMEALVEGFVSQLTELQKEICRHRLLPQIYPKSAPAKDRLEKALTLKEIAKRNDVSHQTVKNRQKDLYGHIRAFLMENWPDSGDWAEALKFFLKMF